MSKNLAILPLTPDQYNCEDYREGILATKIAHYTNKAKTKYLNDKKLSQTG